MSDSKKKKKKRGESKDEAQSLVHASIVYSELPILPVKGSVLFPDMIMPVLVGKPGSLKLVKKAIEGDNIIGVLALRDQSAEPVKASDCYSVGVRAKILKSVELPDGNINVIIRGLERLRVIEFLAQKPYLKARVMMTSDEEVEDTEVEALTENLKNLAVQAIDLVPNVPEEIGTIVANIERPGFLADIITANIDIPVPEKQDVLEALNTKTRLEKVTVLLNKKIEILELGEKIQSQVKGEIDKMQREHYLREQLKAIQKELGEKDEKTAEIDDLQEKIEKKGMTEEACKVAEKELDRLSRMPAHAPEYSVLRTYLDWLMDIPWSESTKDNLDIAQARKILDEDHFDLEKVKKRILEYLAVRKLKDDMKGPILCFVGPPGVGKTSLGKSIARAMGRKFFRMSLGGIRDEAEIRGHRRTYIGALPGRIVQGMKKAGTVNPIFMLDEIDKVGTDFRGDPSSALLEVLDPEQNFAFSDHYLEVSYDLSKVLFIATANILDTIPPALRDRMEVIELPGYTEEDKVQIAKTFLIPKQVAEHGITAKDVRFDDKALQHIINAYTREAGLRNVEREIATICRGVARKIAEGDDEPTKIAEEDVFDYLGPVKFFSEIAERTGTPGVAVGLAWTPVGGDIIFIEATRMKGQKGLTLTGQLGDVMKESAQAALSYVRSNATALGIDEDFFETSDIHVHVPAGAIPKDGPSAGVTIFSSLTSLLTGTPIRNDVAMTGEITLRGRVMPVGGIKEKVLAARRAGLRKVILPEKNRKDLVEIPDNVKKMMDFYFVSTMDEVLDLALKKKKKKKTKSKKRISIVKEKEATA